MKCADITILRQVKLWERKKERKTKTIFAKLVTVSPTICLYVYIMLYLIIIWMQFYCHIENWCLMCVEQSCMTYMLAISVSEQITAFKPFSPIYSTLNHGNGFNIWLLEGITVWQRWTEIQLIAFSFIKIEMLGTSYNRETICKSLRET